MVNLCVYASARVRMLVIMCLYVCVCIQLKNPGYNVVKCKRNVQNKIQIRILYNDRIAQCFYNIYQAYLLHHHWDYIKE